jgi:hypothetical protein
MSTDSEQIDSDYYRKMTEPLILTPADEKAIAALIRLGVRCRGCGELVIQGCMPGCTDRD